MLNFTLANPLNDTQARIRLEAFSHTAHAAINVQ